MKPKGAANPARAEMRFSVADDRSGADMRSPRAYDPAVNDPANDKPGAHNNCKLKFDWLLQDLVTKSCVYPS